MDEADQRHIARDSLFVMADLRLDGSDETHRIKMRNLSSGGMMGESPLRLARGTVVWVEIRNIGWVEGSIAWLHESRFGVAFREEIDPKLARPPVAATEAETGVVPAHIRYALDATRSGKTVRKV